MLSPFISTFNTSTSSISKGRLIWTLAIAASPDPLPLFYPSHICCLPPNSPTTPIRLLLDRAPWHLGPALDEVQAENLRLELLYFPPACPEFIPQIQVCEQARYAISHNHSYPQFQPLTDDFQTYLNNTPFQ